MSTINLSFYDYHRQSYGHMPIHEQNVVAEFMVGDYGAPGEDCGVDTGGEFAIYLSRLQLSPLGGQYLSPYVRAFSDSAGSLHAFLDRGAWDTIAAASSRREITSRDDLTALLLASGLYDRSHHPVGHEPVCHCCGRPT